MGLFLSVHALRQMQRRQISREEVEQALGNPGAVRYASGEDPSATVVRSESEAGRRLKVVVRTDDHDYIITVAGISEEE